MTIHRVLVVDDDPWMHRIIATHLADLPLEIDSAYDGTIAMAKARAYPPDLIISDVMMPGMDGWALVREIRAHAALAFVPFIFLSSLAAAGDVLRGFRLGADDFLIKPFRGAELAERVVAALKRGEQSVTDVRARLAVRSACSMHGRLQDVSLSSLLTLFDMERKTGLLALARTNPAELCRVYLRGGRVVAAASDVGRGLAHALAVYHALYWAEGSFSFSTVAIDAADCVQMTTTQLLMNGARRMDEALRVTFSLEAQAAAGPQ